MHVMNNFLKGIGIVAGLITLCILVSLPFFFRDISVMKAKLKAESKTMDSPYGIIEYIEIGKGEPVLISHGTMGGYDVGLIQAKGFMSEKYRFIIPSRFGYLQSGMPADATYEAQADAYAYLLDQLEIDKVVIQGMSAGGVPAIQFAIRHPEKCEGLVLLATAAYAPATNEDSRKFPLPDFMYKALLKSDYIFWTLLKLSPSSLHNSFSASEEMKQACDRNELELLNQMVGSFLPVSQRYKSCLEMDGPLCDNLKEMPLEKITAPSLIISAKDDTIALPEWSEYTAKNIRGSQFISFETGGHILLGHHNEVKGLTDAFIEKCTSK